MKKDISYEEEISSMLSRNKETQDKVIKELALYKKSFIKHGVELSYQTAPTAPYPDVIAEDRESGEAAVVWGVHNKEDFIKRFPGAVNVLYDSVVVECDGIPEVYDYLSDIKDRFTKGFRKATERDRESLFKFSLKVENDGNIANAIKEAILGRDVDALLVAEDKIFMSFMEHPGIGSQWDRGTGLSLDMSRPEAGLANFSNPFTGEEISILAGVSKSGNLSCAIEGEICSGTAKELEVFCRKGMKEIGFSLDNFKEKWDKCVAAQKNRSRASLRRPAVSREDENLLGR